MEPTASGLSFERVYVLEFFNLLEKQFCSVVCRPVDRSIKSVYRQQSAWLLHGLKYSSLRCWESSSNTCISCMVSRLFVVTRSSINWSTLIKIQSKMLSVKRDHEFQSWNRRCPYDLYVNKTRSPHYCVPSKLQMIKCLLAWHIYHVLKLFFLCYKYVDYTLHITLFP